MKVAITCNTMPRDYNREEEDTFAEFDSPETVEAIRAALLKISDSVVVIQGDEGAYDALRKERPDFVFNIAEGIQGESREAQIPAVLEMLGIPYTGSGVETLAITLDKARTKEILSYNCIPTPKFQLIKVLPFKLDQTLKFPLFVKPNFEGSSRGITSRSLVTNKEELEITVSELMGMYNQPLLVEEYLPGKEFTVSLLGNDPPHVLPIVEVDYDSLPAGVPRFDSYEVKWIYDSKDSNLETVFCPARIEKELEGKIWDLVLKTFRALDIRDLCRIDIRLDNRGNPHVLEVNALPGLIPDPEENSRFPKAAFTYGYSYDEIIGGILRSAAKRTGRLELLENRSAI